jgi:hypothetical protein
VLLLVSNEAAKYIVFFGGYVVALAFIRVPYFAVFTDLVPPEHEDALSIGEGFADDEKGFVVSSSLDLIDIIEVVAQ